MYVRFKAFWSLTLWKEQKAKGWFELAAIRDFSYYKLLMTCYHLNAPQF